MFLYVKALHIIFVVTWFAGLFYFVRLLIYHVEAQDRENPARDILSEQYRGQLMRLWRGITVPSAVLTAIFGLWMLHLYGHIPGWLWLKLGFVVLLYLYHASCWYLYRQHKKQDFRYSGFKLRIWNEVATLFLFAIVFLVVLKNSLNTLWAVLGLLGLMGLLMAGILVYRKLRSNK